MLAPELIKEFIQTFANEIAEADRHAAGMRSQLEAQLADVERRHQGVVRAIENGAWSDALRERWLNLRHVGPSCGSERGGDLSCQGNRPRDLEASLNAPEIKAEASDALRSLIDRVVLTPDPDAPDGLRAELHGDLTEILRLGEVDADRSGRREDGEPKTRHSPERLF